MTIDKNFLYFLSDLKQRQGLKIIDAHIHPLDVMGIVHANDNNKNIIPSDLNFFKPGIMEKMEFGRMANFLSQLGFRFFPKIVIDEVKATYNNSSEKRILDEMERSLIDETVLLPVEPWATTKQVGDKYQNKKFFLLGSIDVNGIDMDEIEERIKRYVNDFNIIGLKLHPNLQNFKPQPSHNSKEISEKLKLIYKTAERFRLYLLFHGGFSNFTKYVNPKYGNLVRSKDNALLSNFCEPDGASEIFGQYDIPIIIAHLGHFGMNKLNKKLLKAIIGKYKNVYFDTAAVSPKMIKDFIELVGSKRIILGSDALYNRMIYGAYFVYQAALEAKIKESNDEILANILGRNFRSRVLANCYS